MKKTSDNKTPVAANERTTLITAVGIILGFAFTFFGQWSLGDQGNGWGIFDYVALGALSVGIAILIVAMYRACLPVVQYADYYETTVKIFVLGIVIVFCASVVAVFV